MGSGVDWIRRTV